MSDASSGNSLRGLNGLLCPSTLKPAIRSAHDLNIEAREGLKELLSSNGPAPEPKPSAPEKESEFSRWGRGLELLVEDFLQRKAELLRLNKARRVQIEDFLRNSAGRQITLESALQSRIGADEHEALRLFAYQASVFFLLQLLLLKRWSDQGLWAAPAKGQEEPTLNWQITSFLKKNARKGMIGRHDWSFLKQNIYSWFTPSKETRERLRLLIEAVNLAGAPANYPSLLMRELGQLSRLSLLGFSPTPIDSSALWRLLLEQKAHDARLNSVQDLDFASATSGAVLFSGLKNGESLSALRQASPRGDLVDVWAFTDSDFERYLSEVFILWESSAEVPRINILPRTLLQEAALPTPSAPLFAEGLRIPYHAQFAACFQQKPEPQVADSRALLEQLREGGLLLIASDHFWPTDDSVESESLRELSLRKSAVRIILDLRQLSTAQGDSLPKGVFLLEKCTSKELRDSNRPLVIRAKGRISAGSAAAFWDTVVETIKQECLPGEVTVRSLGGGAESVKIEIMAAAASQHQLTPSAWNTLCDPAFYDASGRLRRSPHKSFTMGTILRMLPEMNPVSPRAILLQERTRHLLAVGPGDARLLNDENPRFLFLPDSTVVEHQNFLLAQIYSAPVQFWYRLETEQSTGKKARSADRQAEQRLKLMPLLRLFETGTLLPAFTSSRLFPTLEECRRDLSSIFRQSSLGLAERSRLHEVVVSLENSVRQHIESCRDFARHVYPQLTIERWELPSALPEPAPARVLEILSHLDHSPILLHPAIHVTKLRNVHDFKVTNVTCDEAPMGGFCELKIFHGVDAALRLNGPSIFLKAAFTQIQERIGRPWREVSERLHYPTDAMLVRTQLQEVLKSIDRKLQQTRDHLAILDQIFCCLLGLAKSFEDDGARTSIRRHLSPDESRINLRIQRDIALKSTDSGIARTLLQ